MERAVGMTSQVLCKHKDLGFSLQDPCKGVEGGIAVSVTAMLGEKTEGPTGLLAAQSSRINKLCIQFFLSQKVRLRAGETAQGVKALEAKPGDLS